ncbi:MAG: hypothetical protein ABIG92_02315 [Candidatus Omnitrophota bacterium]
MSKADKENDDIEKAFQEFLNTNAFLWQQVDKKVIKNGQQYVLIEGLVNHMGYVLLNLIIGRYVMDVYGIQGAALLHKRDRKLELLFKSYGISKFFYLSDRNNSALDFIRYTSKAVHIFGELKNIDDFLNLKLEDVHIGKIVYDTYLRTSGFGTADSIQPVFISYMREALCYQDYLKKLFDCNAFPVLIQSDRQFMPGAIVYQVALKNGTVVYSRGGKPKSFTVCRFKGIDRAFKDVGRFERKLFEYVWQSHRIEAVCSGGKYINKRFKSEYIQIDSDVSYDAFKKENPVISRQELCDRFGWDVDRPIVGVMSNMMTEVVFANSWSLFKDPLTWLRVTLMEAKALDHVNWLIKPHPWDEINDVKTTAKKEYKRLAKNCKHIKLFPENVNTGSLPSIVNVILTTHGSAGYEYSVFGIPCVIGGETIYSGLGFTHEPKTKDEYFSILKNVHTFKSLSKIEVEKAKVFSYIYLVLSKVTSDLSPVFSAFGDYDEKRLWMDAKEMVQNTKFSEDRMYKMFQIQIKNKYRHLLNYDWIGLS